MKKKGLSSFALLFCATCLAFSGCRRETDELSDALPVSEKGENTAFATDEETCGKITAVLHTSLGKITCLLYPDEAPVTVDNFVSLARGTKKWVDPKSEKEVLRPLYDGTIFHRVIPEFMIQGGDPLGVGIGGPGYQFKDEISTKLKFDSAGILAMANAGPDTNGSQFFITVAPTPWLNGRHTIFGRVVSGQEVADAISKVERNNQDMPINSVILEKIEIIEDA